MDLNSVLNVYKHDFERDLQNIFYRGIFCHTRKNYTSYFSLIKTRVLSILEANVASDVIHDYIDNYSSVVRVLNYKNEKVLDDFKDKVLSTDNPFVKDIVFK